MLFSEQELFTLVQTNLTKVSLNRDNMINATHVKLYAKIIAPTSPRRPCFGDGTHGRPPFTRYPSGPAHQLSLITFMLELTISFPLQSD